MDYTNEKSGNKDVIIPDWHKGLVRERMDEYNKDPDTALDFESAISSIEEEL